MSMLDAFFAKGFKAAKCKTLLKLTIPRIKLLRNRREIQLKQMRRDISKLLETGQEATARIRVEHIIREENMMAAQEIIELFCELIVVRLPIIETQRDCPLDLKEAISTICFAAPRCSDLSELQQIQMLFASKYGSEFVSAASELMPDCGVNRQVIELLSVRAPSPETKLKLLKEIAEEHELDWDPSATEAEFFKSHEDLLNGPTMFTDGSKLPLPEEKHTAVPVVVATSPPSKASIDEIDSDSNVDSLEDFPQVPSNPIKPTSESTQNPDLTIHQSPNLFATEADELRKIESSQCFQDDYHLNPLADHQEESVATVGEEKPSSHQEPRISVESNDKQFLSFMPPPSSSFPISEKKAFKPFSNASKIVTDTPVDLQDLLAAARDAAESAERAAAAARSAASLAEVRISEIMKKRNNLSGDDSGSGEFKASDLGSTYDVDKSTVSNTVKFDQSQSFGDRTFDFYSSEEAGNQDLVFPNSSLSDLPKEYQEVGSNSRESIIENAPGRLPQRLGSIEEDSYFSYPNLFTSTSAKAASESEDRLHFTHKPE